MSRYWFSKEEVEYIEFQSVSPVPICCKFRSPKRQKNAAIAGGNERQQHEV